MIWALLLLAVGVLLSAFFSGSETGFYRVNRVRLALDTVGGDYVSRGLLSLTNHPAVFVATVLVGNNVANYLTSLAVVMGARSLAGTGGDSHLFEIAAPILLAPVLFVYGELLPKKVYYQAPNRMLRLSGLPLMVCAWLFLPVTAVLWVLGKALELLAGESPQRVQATLARTELGQVFDEGHDAGILHSAQRGIAQGLFALANRPVREFVIPSARVTRVRLGMSKAEILRIARRHRQAELPVEEPRGRRKLIGYLRAVDLSLSDDSEPGPVRPLVEVPASESHLEALIRLEASPENLGHVIGAHGETVGFVTARHLSQPLFLGS